MCIYLVNDRNQFGCLLEGINIAARYKVYKGRKRKVEEEKLAGKW